jgi:predicted dehydrogenase
MVREFRECIQQERPPLTDGEEGIKDLAIVLAAYRSAAERRHVPLSEFNLASE